MREHYYEFVELTSEELTDIQGGENWVKTLADWYIGFRKGLGFRGQAMNEMNDKSIFEELEESKLALLTGGSKESYQQGLMVGFLLRSTFLGIPFFRR